MFVFKYKTEQTSLSNIAETLAFACVFFVYEKLQNGGNVSRSIIIRLIICANNTTWFSMPNILLNLTFKGFILHWVHGIAVWPAAIDFV